jgi:hypothetical protein
MAGGRPAGPQMPPHEVISKPGRNSAIVGCRARLGGDIAHRLVRPVVGRAGDAGGERRHGERAARERKRTARQDQSFHLGAATVFSLGRTSYRREEGAPAESRPSTQSVSRQPWDRALDGNGENPVDLRTAVETTMRWLVCLVLAALAGVAGGCADNTYSPFAFKEFPGYTPPGAKAPADSHRTSAGYAP